MGIRIEKRIEHDLGEATGTAVARLRDRCFPEFGCGRPYYKQLPHFRLLAFEGDALTGHLGVDHRVVRFGTEVVTIFGAIDLCVAEDARGRGVGSALLAELEQLAVRSGVGALLLFASDQRLYQRCGFALRDASCSWLRIDDHRNYGMAHEEIVGELMLKQLDPKLSLTGEIDLLGYLF